jgi:hypothetical protein
MTTDSQVQRSSHAIDNVTAARVSQNTRYLLWREGIPQALWLSELRARLSAIDRTAISNLLTQGAADRDVLSALALVFKVDVQNLIASDLLARDRVDVFKENLKYLLGCLQRGGKKPLAAYLTVNRTTLSKWLSGVRR